MVLRCKLGRINKGYLISEDGNEYELLNSSNLNVDKCICLLYFVKKFNKWKVIRRFKF